MDNREIVGVFQDAQSFQDAIDELLVSGFNHADISLLANDRAVEEKLGHAYRKAPNFTDRADIPTTAYISPESRTDGYAAIIGSLTYLGGFGTAGLIVASGGAVAAAIIGAALATGAGAGLGTALARFLDSRHAENLAGQVAAGGLLLWVRAWDAAHEERALAILKRHGGLNVHAYDIPLAPTSVDA